MTLSLESFHLTLLASRNLPRSPESYLMFVSFLDTSSRPEAILSVETPAALNADCNSWNLCIETPVSFARCSSLIISSPSRWTPSTRAATAAMAMPMGPAFPTRARMPDVGDTFPPASIVLFRDFSVSSKWRTVFSASPNAAFIVSPKAVNCDAIASVWPLMSLIRVATAAEPRSMSSVFAPKLTWTSVSAIALPHLTYAVDLAARRGHVTLELLERHVALLRRQVEVLRRQVLHRLGREQPVRRDPERRGDRGDDDPQRRVAPPVSRHQRHVVERHLPDLAHWYAVLDERPEQVLPELRVV